MYQAVQDYNFRTSAMMIDALVGWTMTVTSETIEYI